MPPVIAAVAVVAAYAAVTTTFVLTTAMSLAMMAFSLTAALTAKKPKAPSTSGLDALARDRTITVRAPVSPWTIVYGQVSIGGVYTFIHTTESNKYFIAIITLTGRTVHSIDAIRFDETIITLAPGSSAGRYIVTGQYAGFADLWQGTGDLTHADDQALQQDLQVIAAGKWTAAHQQNGKARLVVRLQFSPDIFPQGIPNITAVVKGCKCYDPRDGAQSLADPTTWQWTSNPAICLADYLTNADYGLAADWDTEIDEDALIEAANICDEFVPLNQPGSPTEFERRYSCDGTFTTDQKPKEIIEGLLTSMSGRLTFIGGMWRIRAGAYRTPALTLTEDDLRGGIVVQSRITRRDNFNAVKGIFVNRFTWQPADFPPVISDTAIAEDNGERVFKDVSLPFTTSAGMAQRLAKIELLRGRQQITVVLPCKLIAYQVQAGDTVAVDNEDFGWTGKVFEVVKSSIVLEDDGYLGVDLELRETAANVFDWAASEEQLIDAAPDSDLPSAFAVGAVSNLALASGSAHLLELSEGSILSRIYASWDALTGSFVEFYEIQSRKSTDADYQPSITARGSTSCYVMPVEDGIAYDVRVRGVNALGVAGPWTTVLGHMVVGKTEAPPSPDTFTVERTADGTRRYAWSLDPLPADVRSGGGFNLYYKVGGGTPLLSAMARLNALGPLSASPFESNELAAGNYAFAVTTIDSSGNESEPKYTVATIGDPRLRNVLLQRLEHDLLFPGSKTDCYLDTDNVLRAGPASGSPQSDWASLAGRSWTSLSGVPWETVTPRAGTIVYRTPIIDLGSNVNFTPLLTVVGNGTQTLRMATGIDGQSPTVDAFGSLASVSARRYVQFEVTMVDSAPRIEQLTMLLDGETQTDEFEDINIASFSAAYFQRVGAGHFRVASKSGLMSSITMATIRAIQNVGPGWTSELISKSASVGGSPGSIAAEFKIYNNLGVGADAVVDVELRGPKVTL